MPPFSAMGPFNDKPYAIGERPGGSYIPSIPLLSGKEAWDSIRGYYDKKHGDSKLLDYVVPGNTTRPTDAPAEKKAGKISPKAISSGIRSAWRYATGAKPPLKPNPHVLPKAPPKSKPMPLQQFAGKKPIPHPGTPAGDTALKATVAKRTPTGVDPTAVLGRQIIAGGGSQPIVNRILANRSGPGASAEESLRAYAKAIGITPGPGVVGPGARSAAKQTLNRGGNPDDVGKVLSTSAQNAESPIAPLHQYQLGRGARPADRPDANWAGLRGGANRPAAKPVEQIPSRAATANTGTRRSRAEGAKQMQDSQADTIAAYSTRSPPPKPPGRVSGARDWLRKNPGKATIGAGVGIGGAVGATQLPQGAGGLLQQGIDGLHDMAVGSDNTGQVPTGSEMADTVPTGPPTATPLAGGDPSAAPPGGGTDPTLAGAPPPLPKLTPGDLEPTGGVGGFLQQYWPHMAATGGGAMGLYMLAKAMKGKSKEERDRERWAALPKMAADDPQKFATDHPIVTGFLIKCGEEGLRDSQIRARIEQACVDPVIWEAFEKVAATPIQAPAMGGGGAGVTPAGPTQPPLPGAPQLDELLKYWDAPKPPTGANAWRGKQVSPGNPISSLITERFPEVYEGNVVERGPSNNPSVLGSWATDPATGKRTPQPNQEMTAAYQDTRRKWDAWVANRRLWEQKWTGMGDEGSREFWKQMQSHQGEKARNMPASPRTSEGLDSMEQAAKNLGYRDYRQYSAARERIQGEAKTPYTPQWKHAFGNVPEEYVRMAAEGDIFREVPAVEGQEGARRAIDVLLEADPRFATVVGTRMQGLGPNATPHARWSAMSEAAREHYQPRLDVYNFAQKAYGDFGGEHTMTGRISGMPGGQAYSDVFEDGKLRHWEDEPRMGYRAQGPVSNETTSPFERIRGSEAGHDARVDREHRKAVGEIDSSPLGWMTGGTTKHFDPEYMKQVYVREGKSDMEADRLAARDRYNLLRDRGKGGGDQGGLTGYGSQLMHNFSDPTYMPSILWDTTKGVGSTIGHTLAAPAALAGAWEQGDPELIKQWQRGMLSAPLNAFENQTGIEATPGTQDYLSSLSGRGATMQAAGKNPQAYAAQVAKENATLAEFHALRERRPEQYAAMLQSSNPNVRQWMDDRFELDQQRASGMMADKKQLAEQMRGSNAGQRFAKRMGGALGAYGPTAVELAAGSQMLKAPQTLGSVGPRTLGSIGNIPYVGNMLGRSGAALAKTPYLGKAFSLAGKGIKGTGKYTEDIAALTALLPALEVGQYGLDEAGAGKYQRELAGNIRQHTSMNPNSNWLSRVTGSVNADLVEDPASALYFGLSGKGGLGARAKRTGTLPAFYSLGPIGKELAGNPTAQARAENAGWKHRTLQEFGKRPYIERGPDYVPHAQATSTMTPGEYAQGVAGEGIPQGWEPRGWSDEQLADHEAEMATPQDPATASMRVPDEATPLTAAPPEANNVNVPPSTSTSMAAGDEATRQGASQPSSDPLAAVAEAAPGTINPQKLEAMPPGQKELVPDAINQVKSRVVGRDPAELQRAAAEIAASGDSPAAQAAKKALATQTGSTPEGIQAMYEGMDSGAKLMLWLGMGIGAIGLISAVASDGGMMPLILGLAGIAVAGGAAAHGGMLGDTAQGAVQGLMGGGGEESLTDVITPPNPNQGWMGGQPA